MIFLLQKYRQGELIESCCLLPNVCLPCQFICHLVFSLYVSFSRPCEFICCFVFSSPSSFSVFSPVSCSRVPWRFPLSSSYIFPCVSVYVRQFSVFCCSVYRRMFPLCFSVQFLMSLCSALFSDLFLFCFILFCFVFLYTLSFPVLVLISWRCRR